MMKLKKILVFFAVSLLFFSCHGLFESVSDDSDDDDIVVAAVSSGNYSGIFSGRVENPSSSSSISSARTIMPDFSAASSSLTYSVYALKNGSGTKIEATSVESDGSYKITVSDSGNYIFYAEISDSSSNEILYKGNTDSLSISNGSIVNSDGTTTNEIPTISTAPMQTSSGSGKAAISVDASGTNIGYIKATWTNGSASSTYEKETSSSTDRTFTLYLTSDNSEGSVSSGTYTLSIYFYDNSTNKTELYRFQNEVVQIYDGLESKGTFTVTSSLISGTAYVAGTSAKTLKANSNGANGTYYAPYDSVEKAVNSVIASGSDTMTIYLDGTCTLSSALSLSSAGKTLNINGLNDDADSSVLTGSSKNGIEISAGKVNLKNITVSGFSSTGVLLTYGTLTMESCVVSGNGSTETKGGGIYCVCGTLTLKNCKIKGNQAGYGGGIYNMSTSIEVTDCEISENTSMSVIGGGVYNTASSGTVKFTDCTISKNGGSGASGGGVYNTGTLTLSSCAISENTASSAGYGGGIYNSGTLTISGGTISGNSAGYGGGIYTSKSLTISDSCVIGDSIESSASSSSYSNYASKNGGGIYISGGTAEISSSIIQRNYAAGTGSNTDKTCNGGGGIYITNSSASLSGSTLTITDSKIQYNTATYGGGIYHGFGSVTMTGSSRTSSLLSYNSSTNSGAGYSGNLDTTSGSDRIAARSLTFTKGTVSYNTSDSSGAGMYLKLIGTANISDSDFYGNTAKSGGGALTSAVNTTCTLNNVDITDNSVTSTTSGIGGGLNLQNGTITLTDVSVSGNYGATGGGIYFSNSSVSVSGKITVSQNYNSSAKSTLNNFYFASSKSSDSSSATSKTFTISSALDSDSKIGVTHSLASDGTQVLTSGWKTYNSSTDASTIFSSDDDAYAISTNSEGEVIVTTATTLYETVYLDPTNGGDTNAGSSYGAPVKTMEKAVSLLDTSATNPTIYVMNSISVSDDESSATYWTFALSDSAPKVMLKRYDGTDGGSSFTGSILTVAAGGTVKATGIIFDGNSSVSGTEPLVNVNGTLTLTSCYVQNNVCSSDKSVKGGGICNSGTATLTDSTVSGNTANNGGGIYNEGTVTLSDSTVSGNTASNGGGIYNEGGTFIMSGSSVIGDSTATKTADSSSYSNHGVQGGGIYNSGTLYIGYTEADETKTDSSFSGGIYYNFGNYGGGIYNVGDLYFYGGNSGSIMYNYSSSNGKGVFNSSTFTMNGSAAVDSSNDVYLSPGEYITIGSALTGTAPVATITPSSYAAGTQIIKSASSSVSLSDFVDLFTIDDDDTTDSYTWYIDDDGKLQKNGGTVYSSWSALSTAVSDGLSSSETSLSYRIADISDFNNSTIALSGSSKKVSIVPTCDLTITGSSISSAFFTVSDLTATIGNGNYSTTIGDSSVAASLNFIYMIDANLSLKKCVFQNSTANAAINSSGTLLLKNCTFKNITPSETLGTVYVQNGTATVDSCTFTNCENSDIRTKSSGKLVLQGTLSDTNIYIENSTTAGVVTLDTSLSLASGAGVTFTIGSYDSSVKVFASSDGGEISESFRNNSDIMITDAAGNDYTINADGTLAKKDDSALSSLYTDPKTVSGIPTAGKTYKVSSENDLIYLNALVENGNKLAGVTLQQTKDIALSNSWDPIGNQLNAFMGTYDGKDSDGNSHSVTNLSYSGSDNGVGFFAYVSGATIQNLTVSGSISTTGQWAGGIAGYIDGSTTNTFDNCVNNASITSSKGYAGGIAGAYKVSSGSITIKNCYNTGNISCDGTSSALGYGGIIGYTGSSGTVTVKNCVNTGSVGGNYATGAGGIIGNGDGNRSLENCASTGTITHLSSDNNHGAIAGSYNSALKLTHTYYKEGADSYGRAYLASSTSPTADASGEVISFSSTGALTESETVSSTSYSDVVSALNAWVSSNGSDSYRTWTSSDLGL